MFKKKELKDELKDIVSEIQETINDIAFCEKATGAYKEILDFVELRKREADEHCSYLDIVYEQILDAIKERRDRMGLDTTGPSARLAHLRGRQNDIIARLLIAE